MIESSPNQRAADAHSATRPTRCQSSRRRRNGGRRDDRRRRGVETVEAAITLPILFALLLPVLQITHYWHNEKMLKIATYEAIKAGAKPGGTNEDAEDAFKEYTEAFGIEQATLIIPERFKFSELKPDDAVWIRSRARTSANQLPLPIKMTFNRWIYSGWVYYRKEG